MLQILIPIMLLQDQEFLCVSYSYPVIFSEMVAFSKYLWILYAFSTLPFLS